MVRLTVHFQNPCDVCISNQNCVSCPIRKKWLEKYQHYSLDCICPSYSAACELAMQYTHGLADNGISPYGTDWLPNETVLVHGVTIVIAHVSERLRDDISQALEGLRQLRDCDDE